jgi:methionyl-tRNA formyltransferase
MLPKVVWEMPKLGTINLHASLLPNYRGAAPINWVIINGETKTGVTTFFIDDKIDTGAMITNSELTIDTNENAGQLHDRLMLLGSETIIKTLELIENDQAQPKIQNDLEISKTAYKLNKENCKIDWSKSVLEIHNQIRGLSPYPGAWCFFKDNNQEWIIKIDEATVDLLQHDEKVGKVILGRKEMKIAVLDGFIEIKSLQFPGKKKMAVSELLNGTKFSEEVSVY